MGVSHSLLRTILLSGEWQFEPADKEHRVVFGMEYNLVQAVSVRGGYLSTMSSQFSDDNNSGIGAIAGLVGGFGVQLHKYNLDYAFSPFSELGETHRISLKAGF